MSDMRTCTRLYHQESDLRDAWNEAVLALRLKAAAADEVYEEVMRSYQEPWRRYHTASHLKHMLWTMDLMASDADADADTDTTYEVHRPALTLAVFFHDVVYVPGRQDNEARSILCAADKLRRMDAFEHTIDHVVNLIGCTITHRPEERVPASALFVSMDLAGLGLPWETYLQLQEQVKAEYPDTPEKNYVRGRINFLQGMLNRPLLFPDPNFADAFEGQARTNMVRELDVQYRRKRELRRGACGPIAVQHVPV